MGLVSLSFACGEIRSSPLQVVDEAMAPVAVAVHADATYVADESGAILRVIGGARETIATVDGDKGTTAKLSVGGDESVWYADPHGTFHAFDGKVWREHDLTRVLGGGDWHATISWQIAARAIDDAWVSAYQIAGAEVPQFACHWDGRAWSCERAPVISPPKRLFVSASYVWMLGEDRFVYRRGPDGWRALDGACVRDLAVTDDTHAFGALCDGGIAEWNGTRFEAIDAHATSFAARSSDDVWMVGATHITHFDGTTAADVGVLDSAIDVRIVPIAAGVVEIRAGGRWVRAGA